MNQFSADYCTALYYAAISYHTDVIKLLLENGAKEAINAPDFYHSPKTALVSLENTTNKGGGAVYDFAEIKKIFFI